MQPLSVEVLEDHEEMELLLEAYLQVEDIRSSPPCFICRDCMLGPAFSRVLFFLGISHVVGSVLSCHVAP